MEQQGLLGYYFADKAGKDLALMREEKGAVFAQKKTENIQFIRWVGDIQPTETGNYTFSTSDNPNVALVIDNSIVLEKNKTYPVRLEYKKPSQSSHEMPPLRLFWSYNGQAPTLIPDTCLLHPDFTEDKQYNHASSETLFVEDVEYSEKPENTLDSDSDGIYDEWEKKDGQLMKIMTKEAGMVNRG